MAKPLPGLGLVIGLIAAYVALSGSAYASPRLTMRIQMYRNDFGASLPWLALLLAIAVVFGLLMMAPAIGAGVTTGAGLLLTVVGLAVVLVPLDLLFHLVKLFQWPGTRYGGGYILFDGSTLLLGIPLLLVGIRRWAQEAKLFKALQGPQQPPQQWGGYPGQQPLPPQPQYPQQQYPPQYPGQQPRQ
ncbi:hypothetical protein ACFV9C_36215 [Kribbella sp. NPDC059898]|uniref:hypothetical protein n=1 Tax=Kribbella sp. NPDC059898 TaxID=3346995 RepID=UPI00365A9CE8